MCGVSSGDSQVTLFISPCVTRGGCYHISPALGLTFAGLPAARLSGHRIRLSPCAPADRQRTGTMVPSGIGSGCPGRTAGSGQKRKKPGPNRHVGSGLFLTTGDANKLYEDRTRHSRSSCSDKTNFVRPRDLAVARHYNAGRPGVLYPFSSCSPNSSGNFLPIYRTSRCIIRLIRRGQ